MTSTIITKELIHDLVGVKISEIMKIRPFCYYSIYLYLIMVVNIQVIHGIDLHIERFLKTVKKQDLIRAIFSKHKWESSLTVRWIIL